MQVSNTNIKINLTLILVDRRNLPNSELFDLSIGTKKSLSEISVMNASKVSKGRYECVAENYKENIGPNEITKLRSINQVFKEVHTDESINNLPYTEKQAVKAYLGKLIHPNPYRKNLRHTSRPNLKHAFRPNAR
jgi:hypothetical protein